MCLISQPKVEAPKPPATPAPPPVKTAEKVRDNEVIRDDRRNRRRNRSPLQIRRNTGVNTNSKGTGLNA